MRPLILLGICAAFAAMPVRAGSPVDAKWMEVDGISVPVPPEGHPRVYLRARDLPDLERRTKALGKLWEKLQTLGKTNPQIGAEVDALRYLLGRDADIGKRAAATALARMQSAVFDPNGPDVTRPIGRLLCTGAMVYDWCYAVLTAEQKQAYLEQLLKLARQLECGYPPRDIGSLTGHGSEWMILRDMLSAGLAIYDENPEMYRLAAARIFKQYVPARNFWYPGHAFHQGSSYAETRFVSDMYPLWIFDRMGAGNIFHPSQQFVPYSWIYMRRPDGQLLRSGDGQSKEPKLRSLLNASYYADAYVLGDYLRNPGIDPMSKIWEFLWSDPELKPRPASELPLSRYFGGPYGWMVARTGWDAESVIAEMKVNIYAFGNHQHNDAGAFQIYYKGPLAIDSGLYEGTGGAYGSPHHQNYYKRTIAHNSLLVYDPQEKFLWARREIHNDGGQRLPNGWTEPRSLEILTDPAKGYQTGTVLGHGFGPDPQRPSYTYLKGDITAAYSAKVKDVKRSFVFLNLGGSVPAALVVFDRVVTADPAFRKFWLLHSIEEPAVEGNTVTLALSERGWRGKLVNTALEPRTPEIAKVGGPGKEFWVFDQNYPNAVRDTRRPEEYEVGAWRTEISPKQPAAEDYFLNVGQVMDRESAPLTVQRFGNSEGAGVRIADRVVWFGRGGERTNRPVAFTAPGAGTVKVLITDLAEGTWQVRMGGRVLLPAITVMADEGTLYFEAPAGNYTLLR